jgi:medium-chain acyl-[acyl-carrier-protein] hydrolase
MPHVFRTWSEALDPSIEVCSIALPGRATRIREEPRRHLAPLVDELVRAMLSLPARPFALFGHSFGGLVCFEVARALRRLGAPLPRQLFISACPPPHLPATQPPAHVLPDGALVQRLRELNGTPEAVASCPELMEAVLPAIRADLAAFETHNHEPEPPLPVPIMVFGGAADPQVETDSLEEWRRHTHERFAVRVFPGDHFFVHSAERALVTAIADELGRPAELDAAEVRG